jgi:hypothetical protein
MGYLRNTLYEVFSTVSSSWNLRKTKHYTGDLLGGEDYWIALCLKDILLCFMMPPPVVFLI